MREKRHIVKGLCMSFRAQEILPVYKLAWHLALLQCPDTYLVMKGSLQLVSCVCIVRVCQLLSN